MPLFRRTARPAPQPVDPDAVIAGLRAFAADIKARRPYAYQLATHPAGETPATGAEWAAYPTDPIRLEDLAAEAQAI